MMKTKILLAGLACAMLATSAQAGGGQKGGKGSSSDCYAAPQPSVNWRKCDKTGANLKGANLTGANLFGANLTGANLQGANLTGADLSGASLTNANLQAAQLKAADLTYAKLTGANLAGAKLEAVQVSEGTIWTSGKPCTGTTTDTCQ